MPVKFRSTLFFALILSLSPILTKAAAYWLIIDGNGRVNSPVFVTLYYGSMDDEGHRIPDTGKELKLTGEFKLWVEDDAGVKIPLALSLQQDHWQATFVPSHAGNFAITGINDKHPVVDRSRSGGINQRPIDYFRADYTVGRAADPGPTKPGQKLDLILKRGDRFFTIKAYRDSLLCPAGTKLRVFNPENWEKELTLDKNGDAKLFPTIKGLYIIRLDDIEEQAGQYQQVPYANIRHRYNYYLQY